MGLLDLFKATENEELRKEVDKLNSLLTPEQVESKNILNLIEELKLKKATLESEVVKLSNDSKNLCEEINKRKEDLIILNDEILMQEFGLYEPHYDFATSTQYKEKLATVRLGQKEMIKNKNATDFPTTWKVDGSLSKGMKMTNDNIKQILRTFNTECENAIDKVKFNNIDSIKKRITKSFSSLNKLNQSVGISIREEYLELKIQELYLAYEYQVKKQEEKEEEKRIREELREEAKLQKELDEAKKNISKDLKHFSNALLSLEEQLSCDELDEEKKEALLKKREELQEQINNLEASLKDIDYRQSNQKAGYVYIISNIGAFGKNVYKIGMTRRLEPMDRINELGDASVPFNFDVHAMIFTEDAPVLENALHKAFESKKLNMVNTRREFFNVTLEEIEAVVNKSFDKTVDFKELPEAAQYRESLKIKEALC